MKWQYNGDKGVFYPYGHHSNWEQAKENWKKDTLSIDYFQCVVKAY